MRTTIGTSLLSLAVGAVALANLCTGVAIAARSGQSQDLGLILSWSRDALRGVNPYQGGTSDADYPPNALLIAAPLSMLPPSIAAEVWAILQCALILFVAVASVRLWPHSSARDPALVVACILSWGSVRIGLGNGQLTVLAMAFGMVAAHLDPRRAIAIGVLVGAACMKPHVGVAFVIWLLLRRRFTEVAIAAATVCAATAFITLPMHQGPVVVISDFLGVLLRMFGGPVALRGNVELWPLMADLVSSPGLRMAISASIFVTLSWAIVRKAFQRPPLRSAEALILGCSWTLVFVFHNVYDLILLAPLFAGCAMAGLPRIRPRPLLFFTALWALLMIVDVPGLAWKLGGRQTSIDSPWMHFNRVLALGLLLMGLFATTPARKAGPAEPWPCDPRPRSDEP